MEDLRASAARRHFDRWSSTYEEDRASRWLREVQGAALCALQLRSEDTLLDVACGTGAAVRDAARVVQRAVGFDLSPAMIERARTLAEDIRNVDFLEGGLSEGLPLDDGAFTAVVCTTAFHHFTHPVEALAEMVRVLAPGGRLVIGDANGDQPVVRGFDVVLRIFQRSHVGIPRPSQLLRQLRAAGLANASSRTMWWGTYALVRAERPHLVTSLDIGRA